MAGEHRPIIIKTHKRRAQSIFRVGFDLLRKILLAAHNEAISWWRLLIAGQPPRPIRPQSGRIEARTGLRMMPTFPRSPRSFRTAGFPQYGWKAGLSGGAFPDHQRLKPAPGLHLLTPGLPSPFVHLRVGAVAPYCAGPPTGRCTALEGGSPSAPVALARVRVMLSRSVLAELAPSAPLAGTSRLHRRAAYTLCLRCAGAPRRPASGSGLSLPFRPDMPSSLTRGSSTSPLSSIAMPTRPSPRSERLGTPNSPAIRFARGPPFGASLVRICYGLSGCSPPWTDRTKFPWPTGGFYIQAPGGSVALPAAGYDYNSHWTPLLAGLSPAGMAASLAAPDLNGVPWPPGAFTSRLPTGRSPSPSLDMTTTALDSSVGGTFTRRNGS